MIIKTINSNITNKSINTRVGRLLYNRKEKFFCFGLRDHHVPFSMMAETETTKGIFWNGDLEIVFDIQSSEKHESVELILAGDKVK